MQPPPAELFITNPILFSWLFAGLLVIAVGSMIYHIRSMVYHVRKADKNNENQWTALNDLLTRVGRIEGKCEANHK